MSLEIEVVHKFDGASTDLLEKFIEALAPRAVTVVNEATIGGPSAAASARLEGENGSERTPDAPTRERGNPSADKKRRTPAEKAEDDAADEADKLAAGTAAGTVGPADDAPADDDDDRTFAEVVRDRCRDYVKATSRETTLKFFDGLSSQGVSTLSDEELVTLNGRLDAAEAVGDQEAGGLPTPKKAGMFD